RGFARKNHAPTDPQPRCAGQDYRKDLGGAVNDQPTAELRTEALRSEQREEGPDHSAVVNEEEGGRDTECKAERKSKDRDLRIVGEKEGREDAEPVLPLAPVKSAAQGLGRGREIAPIRKSLWDERVEPDWIGTDEQ